MEAGINPVNWQKPLTLNATPIIFNIPAYEKVSFSPVISNIPSKGSFLHSLKLKQSLLESKKEFLNLSLNDQKPEDEQMEEKSLVLGQFDQKRLLPSKRISFKIKKQSSVYRRNLSTARVTTISSNKVAELTKKFNEMVENKSLFEQQNIKMIIKRVNSQKSVDSDSEKIYRKSSVKSKDSLKVSRKPSVKTKTKPSVYKKVSFKRQNSEKPYTSAKIGYLEKSQTVSESEEHVTRPNTLNINFSIPNEIVETSPNGSVRAAIEIFEKKLARPLENENCFRNVPKIVPKPKLPEKPSTVKSITKNAIQNTIDNSFKGSYTEKKKELETPIIKVSITSKKIEKASKEFPQDKEITKTEFEEEKVQIINIPAVLPQRRCDSMYETLNLRKVTPNNLKAKSEEILSNLETNLIKSNPIKPNTSFLWRDRSPSVQYEPLLWFANEKEPPASNISNVTIDEGITKAEQINEAVVKKQPPEVPPRPINSSVTSKTLPKIVKKKMPLPGEVTSTKQEQNTILPAKKEEQVQQDDTGYEEIGTKITPSIEVVEKYIYEKIIETNHVIYEEVKRKENDETVEKENEIEEKEKGYEELAKSEEKIYEELYLNNKDDGYEPIGPKKAEHNDGYEYCSSTKAENVYETLPVPPIPSRRQQQEPLPPRPPSSSCAIKMEESVSNCYESIYISGSKRDPDFECNYESIYGSHLTDTGSNRDSLLSVDQKSNSLYGKALGDYWDEQGIYKPSSDLSSSDRSDEWIDMTDNEEGENRIIIIREKQKSKKSGWSQHLREQWSKTPQQLPAATGADSDPDHHYESLCDTKTEEFHYDDYDSFDSDSESDRSSPFDKINSNDAALDMGNNRLPEPPNTQPYGLIKFAGKHMKKLKRNFSIDINKTLSRMTKRKPRGDLFEIAGSAAKKEDKSPMTLQNTKISEPQPIVKNDTSKYATPKTQVYQNVEFSKNVSPESPNDDQEKTKSLPRKGFLNKFRKSMSMSAESASELTASLGNNKPKSTFYLTETIDVDEIEKAEEALPDNKPSASPVLRHSKSAIIRPQSPPPPAPVMQNTEIKKPNKKDRKASSWYAEAGLFRNTESISQKRPNTFWYAEVGLYQSQKSSPPSTSSAENSGSTTNSPVKNSDFINNDNSEEYYNMKNEDNYYGGSIHSCSSAETKKDESLTNVETQDIHLRLQDEPLYQFYDAAILESVCYDGSSDLDSDNYEDIGEKHSITRRPSAMELVIPKRNSLCFTRTLWCEIPEVIHSSVLSTLSSHQKKLQEAKFEIITSEVSYLNSLNVLIDHFMDNFKCCDIITKDEMDILFGKVEAVKNCSEKLWMDLEKCWQDNILLHGVCDIVQKHAEENFYVYVPYCENQILLDDTLKQLKERPGFTDFLKQLETGAACQSLTLYSFLMLPMQRITRWPLLVDAVLKRLSQQDTEYYTCQHALATLNKIVNQCNEAARIKERETELRKISDQLEFPKGVPYIYVASPNRWLVRSGPVMHIQMRSDDVKLTFGKRFSKLPIHLFLFNDYLFVTKEKSENIYTVLHYCQRNFVELSSSDVLLNLPTKETQGKNLLFITLLENQDGKTIEMLLSCQKESDVERWIEALTPPKSEDPDETLYECWDCPQVTAIHSYVTSQPDELALSRGDVINVLRKMADGWCHGERIRDGQIGWFPANHTVEIANPHLRARNLKQRYRLLAFSESYLKPK